MLVYIKLVGIPVYMLESRSSAHTGKYVSLGLTS